MYISYNQNKVMPKNIIICIIIINLINRNGSYLIKGKSYSGDKLLKSYKCINYN